MLPQAHTCDNVLELPNYWEALCSRPWAEHVQLLRGEHQLSATKASRACFGAAYVAELLRVYGITDIDKPEAESEGRRVLFADTLGGFEGSWALGSLVEGLAASSAGSPSSSCCSARVRDRTGLSRSPGLR